MKYFFQILIAVVGSMSVVVGLMYAVAENSVSVLLGTIVLGGLVYLSF
jgi:hypothetical protein